MSDASRGGGRRRAQSRALSRAARWARDSTNNALEILRLGQLGADAGEPYEVVRQTAIYRLRHYADPPGGGEGEPAARPGPLLLIPPLMVTAEVYDIAPELSAVALLRAAGVDTWVVDFGAPEREQGGMTRTLDDHVRAVDDAVTEVRRRTARDVHLCGYSQGGMFAYQVAAYRRSAGVASIVTFGAPVDIHQSVPTVAGDITERLARALGPAVSGPLRRIEGLPGVLTSTGFKLLTPRKELAQLADFVVKLHDRDALARRERRRRFLGGEGFVAWPGPALRQFFEDFIVHNRLVSGGFVVGGRTVTLADIDRPILCFLGSRDELARPRAVRAIRRAAPAAEVFEVALQAGHFGLVVGSMACAETWPAVVAWLRWREKGGAPPPFARPAELAHGALPAGADDRLDFGVVRREVLASVRGGWIRLGDAFRDRASAVDRARYQVARLGRLERLRGRSRVSPSRALAEQTRRNANATFFLWRGRAFSFGDADRRVDAVVRGLVSCGVRAGARVGVLMASRPSYLSLVTALNRLGAVALLLAPSLDDEAVAAALALGEATWLACDPPQAARARACWAGPVLALGGVAPDRALPEGVVDMEAIDPATVGLPSWFRPDSGRARDLAILAVGRGANGGLRLSRITNGRWAFSALGVAAACTLTARDTVYCCLPLHHPTGMLVSVGGALVAGARLALSEGFDPVAFWPEVRRYGATVAFYAGDMVRGLVRAAASASDRDHPLRLLAGSGMRADVWQRVQERFGVGVLELYASTERNLVLVNASGQKVGALGRPLPASAEIALVRYDHERRRLVEQHGHLVRALPDAPGVALARLEGDAWRRVPSARVRRSAFEAGDAWYLTSDVLRQDGDGDYWFVDRLGHMVQTGHGAVATPRIEDILCELDGVEQAVVYGVEAGAEPHEMLAAVVVTGPGWRPEALGPFVVQRLSEHERPRWVCLDGAIPMGEGHRPIKDQLRRAGVGGRALGGRWLTLVTGTDRYTAAT